MRLGLFVASLVALFAATFIAAVILTGAGGSDPDPTPTPAPTATATVPVTATSEKSPTEEASAAAPTCDERIAMADDLAERVTAAMEGYDGTWAFAMFDPKCDHMAETDPEYTQYSASAGKIVSIIAALRAVEDGRIEFEQVEFEIEQVLTHSWDLEATYLETFVEQADFDLILEIAGTERAVFPDSWNRANMAPADMARIWDALVSGKLLNEEHTDLVMELASGAIIPHAYATFPDGSFSPAGFRYGQKAGYYISDGVPYFFVGASYIVHEPTGEAFFPVFMSISQNPDLEEPQRRLVFPMAFDFVLEALGPGAIATATATAD